MTKGQFPGIHSRPLPYELNDSSTGPDRYRTTSQRDFIERDLSLARDGVVHAADSHSRESPFSLNQPADSLDRFITTSSSQFCAQGPPAASPTRRSAMRGVPARPVPFSDDFGYEASPGRFATSNSTQFLPQQPGHLAGARRELSGQAQRFGRPSPFSPHPGCEEPERWVSSSRLHFQAKDLVAARPLVPPSRDSEYNLLTLELNVPYPRPAPSPPGRTAQLGVVRGSGADGPPASQLTEGHFVRFADTFQANPLSAHAYASHELLRSDMSCCSVAHSPPAKYLAPVTEAHTVGWQWAQGHRGYEEAPPPPQLTSPAAEPNYHGRKASFMTKAQESIAANLPIRAAM